MSEYYVKPGQKVVIERFIPDFAVGVTKCFKKVYGNGYPIDTYISPEKLIEENRKRNVISIIARTVNNEVVGHVSLFNSAPCNLKIYESGSGVVIPEYRNTKKLFSRMVALSEKIASQEGINGIFGENVCNHPFSQKMTKKLNWITTAIEIDLMPATAYKTEKSSGGRVSAFWCFKTLLSRPHTVYIPKIYNDFFRFLYNRIDDKRELKISDKYISNHTATKKVSQVFEFANVVRTGIISIGKDFETIIDNIEKEAKQKEIICFQVWLNLAEPSVGNAVEILKDKGYFVGGLLTQWFNSDGILMQKLLTYPNWDTITIAFKEDNFIVEQTKKDWESLK